MSEYHRWYVPGGTFFFTVVTLHRRPILISELGRRALHEALHDIQKDWPFQIVAIVLMPNHLHTVWTLPDGDDRYSIRWKRIKEEFSRKYLKWGGRECLPDPSRQRSQERGIWQRRYWALGAR